MKIRPDGDENHNDDDEENEECRPSLHQKLSSYYATSVFLVFIVPALGGLLFGYDVGATSFAVTKLAAAATTTNENDTSAALEGLFVAAPSAGAVLSSIAIMLNHDRMGRRQELQCASIMYILGGILESSSQGSSSNNSNNIGLFLLVILGRIIYGWGIGLAMHVGPTYLGEMLPPSIRGIFVCLKEVFIVLGVLVGYTMGHAFVNIKASYIYLPSVLFSITMLLLAFLIPESARWLVLQGRNLEALKALQFVYRDADVEQITLQQAQKLEQEEQEQDDGGGGGGLFHPSRRAALTAGLGLVILQQVSGQPAVLSYMVPIFSKTGLNVFTSSVLVAAFKLVATILAVGTVERHGRRTLLFIGISCMLVALVALTIAFVGTGPSADDTLDTKDIAILAAMFLYIGGYQVGFGPISWLLLSEVFPQSVRGQAVAIAVQTNFLCYALVLFGVPLLESWWGSMGAIFGLFSFVTAYSIYFVYHHVLETKGLTLEEIEHMFREKGGRNIRHKKDPEPQFEDPDSPVV